MSLKTRIYGNEVIRKIKLTSSKVTEKNSVIYSIYVYITITVIYELEI